MASLEELGFLNTQDDDEELRAKAIESLAAPKEIATSDLDAQTADVSPVGSELLKKYLVDPRKQAEADDTYMRNQMLVGGLRNFLSPKSGESHMAEAARVPAPQDRLKSYADLLSKVQATSKGEREAEYLKQKVSPAVLAKYQELGIPVDENSTYGSLATQEKGLKPIFDAIKGERDLKKMTEMFRIRKEIEQGTKDSEYAKQSAIPGMNLKPGFKPPEKTVEKVRAAKTTVEKMNSLIDEINNEVGQMDTMDTLSPINTTRAAKISALVQALNIQAKTYNDLGVLNGPDMMILTQQIGDPTTIKGILKSGGAPGIKTKLGVLKKGISSGFNTEASNAGFDVPGEQPETKMIKGVPHARNPKDGLWYPVEN